MIRRGRYALLVTGSRLPDGDGLALMRQARAIDPDIEALVIAAGGTAALAVDAIKQGAYDFLIAPFKRAELERGVERALEKRRLAAENRHLRLVLAQKECPVPPLREAPAVTVPIGTPLEDVERLLIRETLRQTGGNKRRAAHLLGIATRTIYRKL
jgi:DNA-binding NtrC family response regulator